MEKMIPLKMSVIIPAYQTPQALLNRCLTSILNQVRADPDRVNLDIIVVDSSSTKIPDDLKLKYPQIQYLLPKRRLYPGEARNFGVIHSNSNYFAFVDSDCEWNPGWLNQCVNYLNQSRLPRGAHGPIFFEHPRISWAFALHLIEFHEFLKKVPLPQRFLLSANLLVSKEFFERVGGFKEDWPACEDIAFLANFNAHESLASEIAYIPSMSVTHADHVSNAAEIFKKIRFMGYWRGRLDPHFPQNLKFRKPALMRTFRIFIGLAFFGIILKRSCSYPIHYRFWMILNLPLMFILCILWGRGVGKGLKESHQPLTKDREQRSLAPYQTGL